MQWFYDWWNALNMLQQSFAVVAIPATVTALLSEAPEAARWCCKRCCC